MKCNFVKLYNEFYVIPTIKITYESTFYLYVDIMWLKWGVEIEVYNDTFN